MSITLGNKTLTILSNFAKINSGLRFNEGVEGEGSKLISIEPSKSLFAHTTISEVLPKEFFIYDLNRFLSILGHPAFKDASITFDTNYLTLSSNNNGKKVEIIYHYADDRLDFFKGTRGYDDLPEVKDPVFSASIDKTQLNNFISAANALNHEYLILKTENGISSIIASNSKSTQTSKNLSSDDYTQQLSTDSTLPDSETCFLIKMFKVIPEDYELNIIEVETADGDSINVLLAKNDEYSLEYMITEAP